MRVCTYDFSMNKRFVLYTEDEGGEFRYIAQHTDEETVEFYNGVVKTGILYFKDGDRFVRIRPAYISLCSIDEGFDFILKDYRPKKKAK